MLLLVEAAQNVIHLVGQKSGAVENGFHVADRRAHVAAADPARDGDHPLQIVAGDFGLAGDRLDRGDAGQREKVAVGGADPQGFNVPDRVAAAGRNPDPQADHLRALLHFRGDHSGKIALEYSRHGVGRNAFQSGFLAVYADVQGVAGQHDPVVDIHHTGHLFDAGGHLRRQAPQQLLIVREYLDLNRLGNGSQIADQVFHQLGHFDLDSGHVVLDPAADVVHHGFDARAGKRLQPHEEVALIGLRNHAAELKAGSPRISLNRRGVAEDGLDLAQQAVGLGQRHAGGRVIVEDESAFVHRRHEARPGVLIGVPAGGQQRQQHEQDRAKGNAADRRMVQP